MDVTTLMTEPNSEKKQDYNRKSQILYCSIFSAHDRKTVAAVTTQAGMHYFAGLRGIPPKIITIEDVIERFFLPPSDYLPDPLPEESWKCWSFWTFHRFSLQPNEPSKEVWFIPDDAVTHATVFTLLMHTLGSRNLGTFRKNEEPQRVFVYQNPKLLIGVLLVTPRMLVDREKVRLPKLCKEIEDGFLLRISTLEEVKRERANQILKELLQPYLADPPPFFSYA